MTLLEVMISLSILSVLIGGTTLFLSQVGDSRYRIEAMGTRDALALRIRRVVNRVNLVNSASDFGGTGNSRLRACIDRNPGTLCDATDMRQPISYTLGYRQGGIGRAVAGTVTEPVRYAHDGKVCTAARSSCQTEWESRAFFVAVCKDNRPSCGDAMLIRTRYQIRNVALKGQRLLPSYPPDREFTGTMRAFTTIRLSTPAQTGRCNPLSVITQVDRNGNQSCSCIPGSVQTGVANGQPLCQLNNLSCPNSSDSPLGFDQNMRPICRPAAVCRTISMDNICSGFIRSVQIGGCVASSTSSKKKKSDSDSSTQCSQSTLTCCEAR